MAPAPRPLRAAAALLALGAGACASSRPPRMTFSEAGLVRTTARPAVEPEAVVPPAPPAPVPRSIAAEPVEGPPIDPVLLRFAAELDRYLARALPQTPLLELVRTRVTVEAEWDYDRRRFGPAPPDVAALVDERVRRLALRMEAARALGLVMFQRPPPARLAWPITGAALSSLFGRRADPFDGHLRMHYGIDLAADVGRLVTAAAKGFVVRAGYVHGYGLLVEVRHAGDVVTRYAHLSHVLCAPGDPVDEGQPLGLVGSTGRSTGPHLHFEVWRGGEARDPLAWLGVRAEGAAGN